MNFSDIKTNLIKYRHNETEFYMTFEVGMNNKNDIIYVSKNDWGINVEPENGNFNDIEFFVVKMKVLEMAILNSNKGFLVNQ